MSTHLIPYAGQTAQPRGWTTTQSRWTKEEIARLTELAGESLSAAMIAEKMGKTRNQVIGQARRSWIELKYKKALQPHNAHKRAVERERIAEKRRIAPPSQRVIRDTQLRKQSKPKTPKSAFSVTFLELERGMCKYPEGDRDYKFCGMPADGPYCGFHTALCYTVPQPVKRFWRRYARAA